jgi:hypothetical protein
MARRKRSQEIEIFNFSFLDVLACTIGLLIFIMVMAFILQAGSPVSDTAAVIRHRGEQIAALDAAADRDQQIAQSVEMELDKVVPTGDPQLVSGRNAARAARDAAKTASDSSFKAVAVAQAAVDQAAQHESEQAQADLDQARRDLAAAQFKLVAAMNAAQFSHVTFLPRKSDGSADDARVDVYHIDCQADHVVIYHGETNGALTEIATVASASVAEPDGAFQKTLSAVSSDAGKRLLFWVRPAGVATFNDVKALLAADTPYGFEPADADWVFQSANGAGSQR